MRIAAAELRGARSVERSEEAQQRGSFLWMQPGMFNRGKIYGEMDNLSLAAVVNRVDEAAPPDDGRSLAQRRADGLVALATHACAGAEDSTGAIAVDEAEDAPADDDTPASRPTCHPRLGHPNYAVSVLIDWRDITVTAAGMVEINAPGCLPTISASLLESIAGDATVQAIICDGERPLTVTRRVRAARIPDDVRKAVRARDRGDRFPGSRRPVRHLHHFDKKGAGHHVDQIIGLADISHQRIHRHGWQVRLDPDTAEVTFTRGERAWTLLPRGTPLRRPPPRR